MKSSKGFTLIELLVVVAIIAILSATILAALGAARNKARLSRALSELSSMRASMELYYNENGFSYAGGFDDTNSGTEQLITSISAYAGGNAQGNDSDANAWQYNFTSGDQSYCADSNGYSGKGSADDSDTQCTPE